MPLNKETKPNQTSTSQNITKLLSHSSMLKLLRISEFVEVIVILNNLLFVSKESTLFFDQRFLAK